MQRYYLRKTALAASGGFADGIMFKTVASSDTSMIAAPKIRKEFPETWLWESWSDTGYDWLSFY